LHPHGFCFEKLRPLYLNILLLCNGPNRGLTGGPELDYHHGMANEHDSPYHTTVQDPHWRDEEFQWVRILASGQPAAGMVLLYIQKACTAFHEFEPACHAGAVNADQLDFFRRRLAQRVRQVLDTMQNNQLDRIRGAVELRRILSHVESAVTVDELAELSGAVHEVNHLLLDGLEAECRP